MRTSVLLLLALGLACAQAACTVSGSLTARPGAWQANGATNTIYDIVVTNSGTCGINSVHADLALGSCSISSAWNIDTISKNAAITGFGPTLAAGGSFNGAGLIISGSCTPALTLRAECGSCGNAGPTTTPATQAPNPPTTAPPTTRPGTSAPPTTAPTQPPSATQPPTVTPTQPPISSGGCSATVTLVPQSSWVDNSASYATYGISITNSGKCPLTALSVAIAFPAGNSITSSWNYDTNTGAVSGFGDSIPVGATTQSPGIIYKGTGKPTASIKSATCQASCSGTPTNPTPAPTNPTPAPSNPTPAPSNPTTAPTTPPVNPTAPPTASPTNPPSQLNASQAVCGLALIIDNFLYKANQNLGLNAEQTKAKYMSYMADVDKYYTHYFNMRMPLIYVYIETDSSFTDTLDAGKLLTDFQDALKARKFGNAPTDACVYHLLTARQPEGTGGLAYVGTACSSAPDYGNTGYVVDGFGNEDADLVIRRSVHEIGHNLGGNHPDYYQNDPRYTCSVNDDNADLRILRSDKAANEMVERDYVSGYQFLNPLAFISDCATYAIRAQLAAFSCLWTTTPLPAARVTFYEDSSFGGNAYTLYAYEGISTSVCYNILPFNDQASSLKISGITNPKGVTLYQDIDCLGTAQTFNGASASDFGSSNDQATSFRFL